MSSKFGVFSLLANVGNQSIDAIILNKTIYRTLYSVFRAGVSLNIHSFIPLF